jgi:ribosomal protein S3
MLQKNINCFFDTTARIKFAVISAEKYDSSLMAHYICIKLKQRYSFLRVINPFLTFFLRSLKRIHIVRGVKIQCSGRLSRKERASYIWRIKGKVPLTTIIAKISYTARIVFLHNSACCVKVWISYPLRFRHLKYFVLL